MKATDQKGFGAVEVLLIAVVVGILGFTGYYVWHSQSETNKAYDDAGKSENASLEYIKDSTQADFEACKKAAGSRMLQTYPEQCVTKDGKVYTTAAVTPSTTSQSDAQNYLIIKEWGVKFKLPDAVWGTSYSMNETTQSAELQLASLIGTPCEKPGWIGHIYRSTIKTNDAMPADSSIPSSAPTAFGGYDYYYTPPQNMCVYDGPYYSTVESVMKVYEQDVVPTVSAEKS